MATTDTSEGYVVDIDYPRNFLPVLAPLNLALVALLSGHRPPDVDRPFAYLDLGCGNGFTPALIAATHSHATVTANDFNPAHIRTARATAAAAGLRNVNFVEASFADLLAAPPPPADFVAVHGIWSWVNAANRARIAALLARVVKPGGFVVISYNCHPGWDALVPLRRLMIAAAGRDGPAAARVERALAGARQVRDAGADYFRRNPAAASALDSLDGVDRGYLAHEYLNDEWTLFDPGEVADAVAPAGLTYVGQAKLVDNLDALWLSDRERALVGAADGAATETLRDLIVDRRFRRDVFVRDGARIGAQEIAAWFAARRFVLARPRSSCVLAATSRTGALPVDRERGADVIEALSHFPATGGALAAKLAATGATALHGTLAGLVAMGFVLPALSESASAIGRAATDRFNAVALAAARRGDPAPALASPVSGTGVALPPADQLRLDAHLHGVAADDADDFIRRTLPALQMLGVA